MSLDIKNLKTYEFGGTGGNFFTQRGIKSIAIRHGSRVDAIIINDDQFGGNGGEKTDKIILEAGEYIERIGIRHGSAIDYLEIRTSKGRSIKGGGTGGDAAYVSGTIVAIGGRSGSRLDQLMILVEG